MPLTRLLSLVLAACIVCTSALGQEAGKTATASAEDVDMSALIHETQQSVNTAGYAGLIWWIPTRYWEISLERAGFAPEKAEQR